MNQRTMGWITVLLLFIVYGINYLDRVALSIVAPMVQKDLGIDAAQMGIVFSTFFVGYALFNFVGGLASDRLGPKLVYVLAVGLWSIFCGMTAITVGFVSLLIVRLLFGMAEGPLCSAANKMVNNWLPRESAATAMGLLSAGSPLGGAIAGPIVGMLAVQFGWRPAFWIVCVIGLAWVLVWVATTSDRPAAGSASSAAGLAGAGGAVSAAAPRAAAGGVDAPLLRHYLKQPRILATGVAFFGYNYVLFFFLSWFPSYLVQAHHLNIREMSVATVVPWLVGTVGLACGGFVSDVIYKLTGNAMLSRRIVLVTCLLGAGICVAIAGAVRSTQGAIALMSVSLFFLYVTGAIYWAIVQDVVAPERVGAVSGCLHCMGSLSGVVGPAVTGFIVERSGSFASAFVLAGAIALVGAVLSALFLRNRPCDARVLRESPIL
ncbi:MULTISPECIES: MFS transporter [Burkholderia]|uniref:Hexuronate transporter n=1 Tax=Burkholderia savannae TaxID=1637837 RepID=A0ABR5T7W2_9BURK|nr:MULTISPECIES: MFS transporter [Burkholderia]AOJ73119.1 hexuronate transporter [Burkholderia savannae]AOJ85089.1 hexuronate transporter [Burkholderia savannae]KGR94110.1 major Facilitator Superfamily protein [Burkholderia sp. ABCPW 111]KVG48944.1 hexuronate transporter [Burkholderia sp. MSMB0265]KVG86405.1 hexuronate transporter [Burkholderia sp. MSMB2040]